MQLRTGEIDGWLRKPDPRIGAVLVYGPDRGLVSERARAYAGHCGVPLDDPFSTVRLEGAEIEADPGRLDVELSTVGMFSDRRLVWVRGASAQKALPDALRMVEAGDSTALLLIEAGDLKKGTALRAAAESGARAIAIPCYADDARALDTLIDTAFAAAGKLLTLEARHLLRQRLGGDRLASRAEIDKLIAYAGDAPRIEPGDVEAVIGDASALSLDAAVDAILEGDRNRFDEAFTRAMRAGQAPFLVLAAAMRQFQALAMMRADMDRNGRAAAAAVQAARPPVFFARRRAVEAALDRFTAESIGRVLDRLHHAVLDTRRNPALEAETARYALMALFSAGRTRRR